MLARTPLADRKQTVFALLAAAAVMAIAGCGGDGGSKDDSGAARTPATAAAAAAPAASGGPSRSIVVLGHSGATGENSDPSRPGAEVRENSWATGTNPAVNSVYARMLARNSAIKGHNINLSQGGATVRDLVSQAELVGPLLPKADLVLIQIMDNDIDCPTTAGELDRFGSTFRTALETLAKGAPESRWFVVSQFGSPKTYLKTLTRAQRKSLGGTGPCDLVDPAGRVVPGPVAKLEKAIHGYESQLRAGCERFAQCRYDGGAFGRTVDRAEYVSSDMNHFSIKGHAKAAAVAWAAMRRAGLVPRSPATSAGADVDKAVDIGGRSLWLTCRGQGSPTVVLLHGQGQDLSSLAGVQEAVSNETRTCSYDRAGQGRSDPGPRPQTLQHTVDDLFELLHTADVTPPYLLAGHSLGGPIAWAAATEHPDEVSGFLSMNGVPRAYDWLPRILPRFTRREQREERAYYRGDNDEQIEFIASDARLKGTQPPDDMPYIIMHGTDCEGEDVCSRTDDVSLRLDRGLARLSDGGRLVTVNAGHEIYLDKPTAVTDAISDLLEAGG